MSCSVKAILEIPLFEDAAVLAGGDSLDNIIRRLSVYDCQVNDSVLDKDIINHGDLFFSALEQFKDNQANLERFINILSDKKCSALIILDTASSLINNQIIELCNRKHLPLIMVDRNISYASMMDAINKLIIQGYYHAINGSKIQSLKSQDLSDNAKRSILNSINPKFQEVLCVTCVYGDTISLITENDLSVLFNKRINDSYIYYDKIHYFILSRDSSYNLTKSASLWSKMLNQYFTNFTVGISSPHSETDINLCFDEAELAMSTAQLTNKVCVMYDANSLVQLLMRLKDTNELYRYHESLVSTINAYKTENDSTLLDTLTQYVYCKGSYGETAVSMNLPEATIRYRIKRLREILNIEDDIVQFHTYITVLAIIDQFIKHEY